MYVPRADDLAVLGKTGGGDDGHLKPTVYDTGQAVLELANSVFLRLEVPVDLSRSGRWALRLRSALAS